MSDAGFLEALRENPDDESLRLIYADWLDERGDKRGEFLRLESALRFLSHGGESDEFAALRKRVLALANDLDLSWLAIVCRTHPKFELPYDRLSRCPLNVPGPFYTCGQCLACAAPEYEAPDLLAPLEGDNNTTYFVRQPRTPEEIERACRAIEVCCVADLRYGGTDPAIIARLGNDPMYCDHLLDPGVYSLLARPRQPGGWARRLLRWLRGRA
jgi:uncharacterized protein (TIGR02996 family)